MSGWRTGGETSHDIYAQTGDNPSPSDRLLGVMDTPELAETAATSVRIRHGPSDMNRLLLFLARADIKHRWTPLRDDDMPIEMREIAVPGLFRMVFDEAGVLLQIFPSEEGPS
jgi:hypothetical protein